MLQRLLRTVPLWLAAAWAFSLTTLGFFVVPMLFMHLPDKAIAGAMAGKLFSLQSGISTGLGLGLLLALRAERVAVPEAVAKFCMVFVLGGMLLALLSEFGVAPHIIARDNLALWHRVGSAMYLVQWICALVVFARLALPSQTPPSH